MNAHGTACEIVHSEINAIIARTRTARGSFPARGTYPLESEGKRNPTVPNRLEPFRDFASVFHDEAVNGQAFPGFFTPRTTPVFRYVLAGVKDVFMINYGSGGIGSRDHRQPPGRRPDARLPGLRLRGVLPHLLHGGRSGACWSTSPPTSASRPCGPGKRRPPGPTGPKANYAIGAEDPSNVHHSYIGDFVKFRNTHTGKEQHVFHLHNHQWLFNPNDDNSNYLDAQGIGPGVGYTYEINFGGSGNRNKTRRRRDLPLPLLPALRAGHVVPLAAQRHDADRDRPRTPRTHVPGRGPRRPSGYHTAIWALESTTPAIHPRREPTDCPRPPATVVPDGEIVAGTPIPALVPLPGKAMPLMPGDVAVVRTP